MCVTRFGGTDTAGSRGVGSFRADAGEAERSVGGDGERDCQVLQGAGGYGTVDAATAEEKLCQRSMHGA